MVYLASALALAIFGAIYEYFSHGVFSYYMIYAFMIPLACGTVPYLISFIRNNSRSRNSNTLKNSQAPDAFSMIDAIKEGLLYHAGIATLTLGSIMKGVLDIYGTTNRLIIVYPVLGAILVISSVVLCLTFIKRERRTHQSVQVKN